MREDYEMSKQLTTEDIIAIAARRAAVSDQPLWEASTDWHWDVGIYGAWAEGRSHFTTSGDATEDEMKAALVLAEADAVFIAHARDDIDRLLAALEAERAANERLRNTKTALLNVMQSIYELAHLAPADDGLGEYDLRERLEEIEEWSRRFEGVGIAPAVNPAAGQDGD